MYKRYILLFFSLYFLLNGTFLTAQDNINKREDIYSLLWKIEGDSLKKPSYLFGTMHVRNKKAFAFSDSVLVKLLSVDVFASEYDIDSMYIQGIRTGLEKAENRILFEEDFSESELNELSEKKSIKGNIDLKRFKNKSFKELKEYFENFETLNDDLMPTYVDAYLHQIAKINAKHLMGMESLESGLSLLDTLSKERQKAYISSKFDSISYFLNSKELMLNLYSAGDIDSIWHFFSNNWYYLKKVLLDNRNVIMVDTMENIMKDHSVFIAAGVAHLPGDSGLIQLFRNKGYSVSKVNATFTGVADSIMDRYSQGSGTWITHVDSSNYYSIEVPDKPTSYEFFSGLLKMYVSIDILKNSAYYFYSLPMVLSGVEKEEDLVRIVKTAFGKKRNLEIVSNKKISFNGIPGYEMVIKDTDTFEAKARIYMHNDHIYLQMAGNDKASYDSEDADRFFESFKTLGTIKYKDDTWTKYTYDDGAFSVLFPNEPNYMKKEVPDNEGIFKNPYTIHMYTCINQKDKEVYMVRWNDLPDGYYYESYSEVYKDMFSTVLGIDYEFDPEKEIKLDAGKFQGYEAVKTLKENSFELRIRAYVRGNRIYLLMGQYLTGNSDTKVDAFFNSFEGKQFLETEYETHHINGLNIQLPAQPIIIQDSEKGGLWYDVIPYQIFAGNDPNNGHLVTVKVNRYPKYFYTISADSLLKEIEEETFYLSEVSDSKTGQNKEGLYFRSGIVAEEDSPNKIVFKYILNGNKSYEVYVYLSDELLQDSLQNKIFPSIAIDTDDTDFDIFRKKTGLIFADLQSSDSVTFSMAKKALSYHPFDSTDIPSLYRALAFNYSDSTESWGTVKDKIIGAIKENHNEDAVRVLKESFFTTYDSKIDILSAISQIDSLQKKLVYDLLLELPDTTLNNYGLHGVLDYLVDSSDFFKEKIPELIDITKNTQNNESLVKVINENFDELKLSKEQLTAISGYCTDLYNLNYDSLLNGNKESLDRYHFIDLMTSVLRFYTYDISANYNTYIKKAEKVDEAGVQAWVCLYNLNRGNSVSSSKIKNVIGDPEYGWDFLVEAGKLNKLSDINKKLLENENLALVLLKNSFYWDDYYVPDNIELKETRKIHLNEKEYPYYVFTFTDDSDKPHIAVAGGFELIDGKLLHDEVFFNYSYETFDSEAQKEEIISDLISLYE